MVVTLCEIIYVEEKASALLAVAGGRSPLAFFENRKKVPDFAKKCPLCVHLWAKFSFKLYFQEYLGKTSKFFTAGHFF